MENNLSSDGSFQKYFDNPNKIGMRLQRMDSDIAVRVCNHFVSRNIPVIPVHDRLSLFGILMEMTCYEQ